MTQAVARLLAEADQLSADERADLADRLVESLDYAPDPDVAEAQIAEVRRRIAQVEAGETELIPGEVALARIRQLISAERDKR